MKVEWDLDVGVEEYMRRERLKYFQEGVVEYGGKDQDRVD